MGKLAHTLEEVLEAVDKGKTKTGAAKLLRVTWQTVDNYCKRWKAVDVAFKVCRREMVDLAEMGLRGAVLRGEPWAVTFALKTLGKDQGYTERTEVSGPEGGPIRITEVVVERSPSAPDE